MEPEVGGKVFVSGTSTYCTPDISACFGLQKLNDSAGNIFGGRKASKGVAVLPVSTGTLFGVIVTANTPAVLISTPDWTGDVAIDGQDNLFIGSWFGTDQGVYVLPKASGTLYGQAVVADTLQQLVATTWVSGLDLDDSNNLYFAQWGIGTIQVLAPANRVLFGESIPADTATVLAGSSGQADQGLAVSPAGDVLASGGPQTVRLTARVAPSVTSISPPSAPLDGGTSVTISGTALSGATSVTFGGTPGSNLVVVDDSTFTVTVPSSLAGAVDVVVTTSGGSATVAGGFTFVHPVPLPPVPAGAPVRVSVEAGSRSVDVAWASPGSTGSFPVSNYQAQATPGSAGCLVSVSATSCVIGGLRNGVAYEVRVRALTGAGWGAWSALVSVMPEPAAASMVITGSRDGGAVVVDGVTTGMVGERVTPWLRFPGPHRYAPGSGVRTVDQQGEFTWQRVTDKKTYVYFRASDGVRSNRVIIPAR